MVTAAPAAMRTSAEIRTAWLAEDLARRKEKSARRYEAVRDAMKRYDQGATVSELWPWWCEATGLSRATLIKVVRGTYETKLARALHNELGRPPSENLPRPETAKDGLSLQLTPEVLLQIRAAHRAGKPIREIACEFGVFPDTVRAIAYDRSETKSMKRALVIEAENRARNSAANTSIPTRSLLFDFAQARSLATQIDSTDEHGAVEARTDQTAPSPGPCCR